MRESERMRANTHVRVRADTKSQKHLEVTGSRVTRWLLVSCNKVGFGLKCRSINRAVTVAQRQGQSVNSAVNSRGRQGGDGAKLSSPALSSFSTGLSTARAPVIPLTGYFTAEEHFATCSFMGFVCVSFGKDTTYCLNNQFMSFLNSMTETTYIFRKVPPLVSGSFTRSRQEAGSHQAAGDQHWGRRCKGCCCSGRAPVCHFTFVAILCLYRLERWASSGTRGGKDELQ